MVCSLVSIKGRRTWRISRDTILFVVGLTGIVYETLFDKLDRPTILITFLAMLGLPAILRTDERGQPNPPVVTPPPPLVPSPTPPLAESPEQSPTPGAT